MDGFLKFLATLGAGRILAMGIVTVGLVGFIWYAVTVATEPDQGLLYTNLEPSEAATIVGRLEQLDVPHTLADGGSTIFAPKPEIDRLRVTLAGEGLGGSVVGYEIFYQDQALGTTSFVQNINHIRALEGELSRSVQEFNTVSSARVHIVLPKRELFSREEQRPSASIIVRTTRGGLANETVRAIQHMVAASVPKLDPQNVAITDQSGRLLAKGVASEENLMAITMEEKRLAQEDRLRNQIESLLAQTVGAGRVRAQVAVELDQNRMTENTESFDPDSQVVRSSTTVEDIQSDRSGQQAQDASVATNLPDGQITGDPLEVSTSSGTRTEETTNFEITRTNTTVVKEAGGISKLSVGVLVDGIYTDAADGTRTYAPRPQTDLDQMSALVASAIGIDTTRGDNIEVVNLQFIEPEAFEPVEIEAGFFDIDVSGIMPLIKQLVLLVVFLLILLTVVRPVMNALLPKPAPADTDLASSQLEDQNPATAAIAGPDQEQQAMSDLAARAAEGDEEAVKALIAAKEGGFVADSLGIESRIDVAQVEGKVQDSAIKKVGEIVSRHPEESASIIRQWLYS